MPLKIQNQISHTLNGITDQKNRWRLKDYEDVRFTQLRERLYEDKGIPDLDNEQNDIIDFAKEQSQKFSGLEEELPEMIKQQKDNVMKHKHLTILSENMIKINKEKYNRENPQISNPTPETLVLASHISSQKEAEM